MLLLPFNYLAMQNTMFNIENGKIVVIHFLLQHGV